MLTVFISYPRSCQSIAVTMAAALKGLGADPIVYQRPDARAAAGSNTSKKLQDQVESANQFVQLLDSRNTSSLPNAGETSLLRDEAEWYLLKRAERGNRKPSPLVIVVENGSAVLDDKLTGYLQWLQDNDVDYTPCPGPESALEVMVGWFLRMRTLPKEEQIVDGYLDVDVARPTIDKGFRDALLHAELLPQKYLYTTPIGALLWSQLSSEKGRSVRRILDTINYGSDSTPCMKRVLQHIAGWVEPVLSVVALGCGDGRRETALVGTLARAHPHKKLRVLLVDISKTLVSKAIGSFERGFALNTLADPQLNFAIADFENVSTLVTLIARWRGDQPCCVLFLGNTLGNISFSPFLASLASALKVSDLLVAEVSVANDAELKQARDPAHDRNWHPVAPQKDDRFEFACNPVRALGIRPDKGRFRISTAMSTEPGIGDYAVSRTFAYQLSGPDLEAIKDIFTDLSDTGNYLQLIRADAFLASQLEPIFGSHFDVLGIDIQESPLMRLGLRAKMAAVVASKGRRQ